MTNYMTPADRLQAIPFEQLVNDMQAGQHQADLEAVFGPALAAEMMTLVADTPPMMAAERPRIVLLPGIMGSTLDNTMGQAGRIWINIPAILGGKLRLLTLNEHAQAHDPTVQIEPTNLFAPVYLPLRIHLSRFRGCDVHVLPFDWRFPPARAAQRLHHLIIQLRTQSQEPIHLVGHSMGGLVARSYCAQYPEEAVEALAQVIMLGTPNAGAVETIRNLTIGGNQIQLIRRLTSLTSSIHEWALIQNRDVYDFVRSLPGVYALLPVPPQGYAGAAFPYPFALGFDHFRYDAYRIAELSAARLAEAARDLASAPQALPVPTMVIAGTGIPTSYGVQLHFAADEAPQFDFDAYTTSDGDGTVLVNSALALPGADWRFVREGRHGDLPLYPNVRRAILMLVHGDEAYELPMQFERGMMDEPAPPEQQIVPATPMPGSLQATELDAIAARIASNTASPEDIAVLMRGW